MTEGLMERVDILIARSLSNLTESLKAEESSTDCKKSKLKDRKPAPQPTGFVSDPPTRDLQKELDRNRNTGHAKKNRKKKSQASPRVLGASAGLNVSCTSAHPSNDESSISHRRLESVKAEKNSTDCKNSNVEDRKVVPQPTGFDSDLQKELNCSRNTGHAKKNRKKKSQPLPKVMGALAGLNASRASAHPSNDTSSISDRRELHVDGFVDGVSIHNNCSQNMGHATKDCNMHVVLPGASTQWSKASHARIFRANNRACNHRNLQTRKIWVGTYATSAQREYIAAQDNHYNPPHYFYQAAAYFDQRETISLDCDLRKLDDEFKDFVRHHAKKLTSFYRKRVL